MSASLLKNRHGFVLVEFMILAAAVALLAMVAITHFKHPAKWRASLEVADNSGFQYAIAVYAAE